MLCDVTTIYQLNLFIRFVTTIRLDNNSNKTHNTRSKGDNLVNIMGSATAHLSIDSTEGHEWKETIFVTTKLCDPATLGSSALSQFETNTIKYQGLPPSLVIASNANLPVEETEWQNFINVDPFPIVTLQENASPIRCPSRFRSEEDQELFDKRSKS